MKKRLVRDVIILKTGGTFASLARRRGDFEDWIQVRLGIESRRIRTVQVHLGEKVPDPARLSGVIITGSRAMVTDRADWSENLTAWLPSAIDAEVPLLGICYGHHLLAYARGAIVGPNPLGGEMGTVEVRLTQSAVGDPLFDGIPPLIRVHVSHFQSVLSHPDGATLLASSVRDPHFAFRYAPHAWGIQFHPEFDEEVARAYISHYGARVRAAGMDPETLRQAVEPSPYGEEILVRFGELIRDGGI